MYDFTNNSSNAAILQQASELADDGKTRQARSLVKEAIRNDRMDVEAWWALTHLAASDSERNHALKQVLALDPQNPHALHMRDQIKAGSLPSLNIVTFRKPNYRINPKYQMDESYIGRKDYTMSAIGTLVLYMVFWIAGLGLNVYFLHEARKLEQSTGIKQQNVGCLQALLGFYVILPLAAVVLIVFLAILGGN